jgi:hypothetical protein
MLPHHGADRNFHESILDIVPDAEIIFVTADYSDERRPQGNVKASLHAWKPKRRALRVSERARDILEVN